MSEFKNGCVCGWNSFFFFILVPAPDFFFFTLTPLFLIYKYKQKKKCPCQPQRDLDQESLLLSPPTSLLATEVDKDNQREMR